MIILRNKLFSDPKVREYYNELVKKAKLGDTATEGGGLLGSYNTSGTNLVWQRDGSNIPEELLENLDKARKSGNPIAQARAFQEIELWQHENFPYKKSFLARQAISKLEQDKSAWSGAVGQKGGGIFMNREEVEHIEKIKRKIRNTMKQLQEGKITEKEAEAIIAKAGLPAEFGKSIVRSFVKFFANEPLTLVAKPAFVDLLGFPSFLDAIFNSAINSADKIGRVATSATPVGGIEEHLQDAVEKLTNKIKSDKIRENVKLILPRELTQKGLDKIIPLQKNTHSETNPVNRFLAKLIKLKKKLIR